MSRDSYSTECTTTSVSSSASEATSPSSEAANAGHRAEEAPGFGGDDHGRPAAGRVRRYADSDGYARRDYAGPAASSGTAAGKGRPHGPPNSQGLPGELERRSGAGRGRDLDRPASRPSAFALRRPASALLGPDRGPVGRRPRCAEGERRRISAGPTGVEQQSGLPLRRQRRDAKA